tara:strand:+ start:799 stop:1638 length:840 start_codon:yes stop_codon:yes gene_type:complete
MDKIKLKKNTIKNYYYFNEDEIVNLLISNNKISDFDFSSFFIILNNINFIKYKKENTVVDIIYDIDMTKIDSLKNIDELDIFQLSNLICNSNKIKINKIDYIIVKESYSKYKKNVKPYIESIYKDNTKWLHDIIKGNREQENILYQDNDIIILKELSMNNTKNFYIIGFPKKKITCIREITRDDLKVLDKLVKCMNTFGEKMANLKSDNLYNFFHYHPSFYHLHIHCTFIENPILNNKFLRSHLYEIVKNNIIKNKNFYRKDLYFEIPKNHIICDILKK